MSRIGTIGGSYVYRYTCREEASVNNVVVPKLLHSNHTLCLGHEHLQLLGYPQEFLLVMEPKSRLCKKDVQNDPLCLCLVIVNQ